MKKLFSLALALCMVCMMIPALAEDSITGVWYTSMSGVTMALTLNEDGSAEFAMPGSENSASGSWTLDGDKISVTIADSPAEGTYADGKITLGDAEMSMVFTREEPTGIQLAEVNPDAAAEDFDGTWSIVYIGYNGVLVDSAMAGQELPGLVVENGSMHFTGESSLSAQFGNTPIPLTYADGALSFSLSAGETTVAIRLEILEDGMLALSMMMGEMGAQMYFVKEAAEEEPAA